jgi:hypothetical protein
VSARGGTAPAIAVLGATLASILPSWAHLPIALYDPVARSFRLARMGVAGGARVEITFYGIYLGALAGFVIGALFGRAIETRVARSPLLDAWVLTALALAASYQIWMLWR